MKRIVGKEFFLIQGDEKDEDSYSSEAEEDVGEEEVEVEGEVAVGKGDIATPMDVVSQDEKTLTRDRNEEEDREDLNDRPAKKLKTSHEDSQSTGNTSSSSSFVSKCIIL